MLFAFDKYGGSLVTSSSSPPKSFNPIVAKETSTTLITGFIYEGLTIIDPYTLKVKPLLAEKWETSADGKVWIFHLRRDVLWNDGVPFIADDVVFTFNKLIYNPDIPTSARDVFTIENKKIIVKKIDKYTVEFCLPEKFAPFLKLLGQEILPRHILEKTVDDKKFNFSLGLDSKPAQIVGTGPFILGDFKPGEWVILNRNPYYWKKDKDRNRLPYLNRIVFLTLPDQNMAVLKFKMGELDVIALRPEDYLILKRADLKNVKFYNLGASLGSEFIVFNQNLDSSIPKYKIEWFRNLLFRKAIAYAIDRDSIIKNIYAGFGVPLYGPLDQAVPTFYNPKITKYPYNINKAKECLDSGGFKLGKDNLLYDAKGNQVSFSLLTNSNNSERIEEANLIRNDMEKCGIKVNFLPIEFNSLVTRIDVTKDWDAVLIGFTGDIDPHGGKNVWMTSGQLHLWDAGSKQSIYPWEKEIDKIFEEGAKEMNEKKRESLYDKWQKIVSDELPLVFTATSSVIYGIHDKFENLNPTVYGGIFYDIEEVYLKHPQ